MHSATALSSSIDLQISIWAFLANTACLQIAEPKDYGKKIKAKAAFADGTTVPAKRARVSNTAEPDAPRNSRQHRSITDFFNSISPTRAPESSSTAPLAHPVHDADLNPSCNAAMHRVAAPSTTDADVFRKDEAGKQAASSTGPRAQAQHDADSSMQHTCASTGTQPSPQSLRQVLAHAALQRAAQQTAADGGSGLHQLQGDITDETTLQSDADIALPGQANAASNDAEVVHTSAVIDLVDDASQPGSEVVACNNVDQNRSPQQANEPNCPVCGVSWPKDTLPDVMYQHVDRCLQHKLM